MPAAWVPTSAESVKRAGPLPMPNSMRRTVESSEPVITPTAGQRSKARSGMVSSEHLLCHDMQATRATKPTIPTQDYGSETVTSWDLIAHRSPRLLLSWEPAPRCALRGRGAPGAESVRRRQPPCPCGSRRQRHAGVVSCNAPGSQPLKSSLRQQIWHKPHGQGNYDFATRSRNLCGVERIKFVVRVKVMIYG